jgi:uncharacterized protein YicC (UPF0701 family)
MAKKAKGTKKKGKGSKDPTESLRKKTIGHLEEIDAKLTDMGKAWNAVVKGLQQRSQERYDIAVDKLMSLSTSLRELAIVDMKRVSKVLQQLNEKVGDKVENRSLKISEILKVDDIFKKTTTALDDVLDVDAGKALKQLKQRLDELLQTRTSAMKALDSKVRSRLRSSKASLKKIRSLVPKADGKQLDKIASYSMAALEGLADFSMEKVQTRKKDLERMNKMVKSIEKKIGSSAKKLIRPKRPKNSSKN